MLVCYTSYFLAISFIFRSAQFRILSAFVQKDAELGRTIRKIKEISGKKLCGYSLFLPLANSNIYFYKITFSFTLLVLSAR